MDNIVYESLPTDCVDLDKVVILTLDSEVEDQTRGLDTSVDRVSSSGILRLLHDSGIIQNIHWGKTAPNEWGTSTIIVDAPMLTLPIIQCLWVMMVIEGEYPSCSNRSWSLAS